MPDLTSPSTTCRAQGHRHPLIDLRGRTAIVTGGAAGIGYFTAEGLARLGAHVVIAARNPVRARAAQRAILSEVPAARVSLQPLDLADLASVRAASERLASLPSVDVLVANAGAVGYPDHVKPRAERGVRPPATADGHELFWGTNFLGHYALVAALLPLLCAAGGRLVLVGSLGDRGAKLAPEAVPPADIAASDLVKYLQSKLATTTLMHEVARRASEGGEGVRILGAHPGTAVDAFSPPRPGVATNQPRSSPLLTAPVRLFAHGKHDGALPLLTAVACPEADNGSYWGPRWLTRGRPVRARTNPVTQDPGAGGALVAAAADLTGINLPA